MTTIREAMENSDSIRMFENSFLERMSHVHPATPFFIYTLIILFALFWPTAEQQMALLPIVISMVLGIFSWTIVEYVLHRFLFRAVYFYTHGSTTKNPTMPPGWSYPLVERRC